MNSPDKHLEQRARGLYREACQQIDPTTAGRLRAARRGALEAARAPRQPVVVRWLVPTGALAMVAVAAMMVWQPLPQRSSTPPGQTASAFDSDLDNELPPDADQADPHLYQNLDFYGWLAASNPPANR